jgi:hypothetical protein
MRTRLLVPLLVVGLLVSQSHGSLPVRQLLQETTPAPTLPVTTSQAGVATSSAASPVTTSVRTLLCLCASTSFASYAFHRVYFFSPRLRQCVLAACCTHRAIFYMARYFVSHMHEKKTYISNACGTTPSFWTCAQVCVTKFYHFGWKQCCRACKAQVLVPSRPHQPARRPQQLPRLLREVPRRLSRLPPAPRLSASLTCSSFLMRPVFYTYYLHSIVSFSYEL